MRKPQASNTISLRRDSETSSFSARVLINEAANDIFNNSLRILTIGEKEVPRMTIENSNDCVTAGEVLKIHNYFSHIDEDKPGDLVFECSVEAVAPKAAALLLGGGASAFIDQVHIESSVHDALARFRLDGQALHVNGSVVDRISSQSATSRFLDNDGDDRP